MKFLKKDRRKINIEKIEEFYNENNVTKKYKFILFIIFKAFSKAIKKNFK